MSTSYKLVTQQIITVYNLVAMGRPYYGDYMYPNWAVGLGWCIAVSSLLPIPICFLFELLKHEGTLTEVRQKRMKFNEAITRTSHTGIFLFSSA